MRLAEILSDLVSLRVCDPAAALALVSARPATKHDSGTASTTAPNEEEGERTAGQHSDDADLVRAKELVRLHYQVKVAQQAGVLGRELDEARRDVERALTG